MVLKVKANASRNFSVKPHDKFMNHLQRPDLDRGQKSLHRGQLFHTSGAEVSLLLYYLNTFDNQKHLVSEPQ